MKLEGRRESSNVDDRRGQTMKRAGGLGLGGTLIVGLLYLLFGGNPAEMINQLGGGIEYAGSYTPSAEEEELATFSKKILAGTEDVWTKLFRQMGKEYIPPKLVLYSGQVQTSGGVATSDCGPFYYSGDQSVYIDLSFFMNMKREIGADGDFAYAYVIAHEVGHHVQHLLGTLDQAHAQMSRMNSTDANKVSVRIELQADFYAGVWGYYENKTFKSLDDGDLREAIECAAVIGDDYLQKKATGGFNPESFTHGSSDQRMKWLKLGLTTGDMSRGNTFSLSDREL